MSDAAERKRPGGRAGRRYISDSRLTPTLRSAQTRRSRPHRGDGNSSSVGSHVIMLFLARVRPQKLQAGPIRVRVTTGRDYDGVPRHDRIRATRPSEKSRDKTRSWSMMLVQSQTIMRWSGQSQLFARCQRRTRRRLRLAARGAIGHGGTTRVLRPAPGSTCWIAIPRLDSV